MLLNGWAFADLHIYKILAASEPQTHGNATESVATILYHLVPLALTANRYGNTDRSLVRLIATLPVC